MRWHAMQGMFDPSGFLDTDFWTTSQGSIDIEGIRTILMHYMPEGYVTTVVLGLEPDEDTGDYAVLTTPECEGYLRIRELNLGAWTPVTADIETTWRRAAVQSFIDVEVEITVPPDGVVKELQLIQVRQLAGTI